MNQPIGAPKQYRDDVYVWVDEAIWGHRLYNDQTPWLVFLEFMAIFRSRQAEGVALNESRQDGAHENFTYEVPRLIPLRQLIFNNPYIRHVEETQDVDSNRWQSWLESFATDDDFGYLRDRFISFARLARVVEFFQTTAIEPDRQRRWSSRFLFPYGPNCLYADLPAEMNDDPDRRFFARSGELLYLMLNRSGKGPEIAKLISERRSCARMEPGTESRVPSSRMNPGLTRILFRAGLGTCLMPSVRNMRHLRKLGCGC